MVTKRHIQSFHIASDGSERKITSVQPVTITDNETRQMTVAGPNILPFSVSLRHFFNNVFNIKPAQVFHDYLPTAGKGRRIDLETH